MPEALEVAWEAALETVPEPATDVLVDMMGSLRKGCVAHPHKAGRLFTKDADLVTDCSPQ
ncbi:hypothetical protein MesoLjLa_43840 [Mesorhizobium sp. L-2-11]|nr:hypothetical protein MesoLjLa_43840 [Mesorhizobium sp. L-2-11]